MVRSSESDVWGGWRLTPGFANLPKAMIVGVNLTEEEIKAFKARKEQELGAGWCVDVYRCQGRLVARAY